DISCSEPLIDFSISNSQGVILMNNSIENQSGNLQFDFTPYPSGVYFLTLICNHITKSYKIVKEG
ncbi:MAG: T9SS type A sorting domain-containing protein, partial [Candidatus Kapaibacterium sp.]